MVGLGSDFRLNAAVACVLFGNSGFHGRLLSVYGAYPSSRRF